MGAGSCLFEVPAPNLDVPTIVQTVDAMKVGRSRQPFPTRDVYFFTMMPQATRSPALPVGSVL